MLVVIDPVGLVPVFVSITGGRSKDARAAISRRAVAIAAAVLLLFAILGDPLLRYLGISLAALQIAGGILLFRIGMEMVFAQFRRDTPASEPLTRALGRTGINVVTRVLGLILGALAVQYVVNGVVGLQLSPTLI